MNAVAVIVAAGRGVRLQSAVAKPFVELAGKPILFHTLAPFSTHPLIREIIIVLHRDNRDHFRSLLAKHRLQKTHRIIEGGETRSDSVRNGLQSISSADYVVIHDGARPFVSGALITATLEEAQRSGAAVAGVPVTSTLKAITAQGSSVHVTKTLDRDAIWQIQTPQTFSYQVIVDAYQYCSEPASDDAALVERSGHPVSLVKSTYTNIKITTPDDLLFAQAILSGSQKN